MPTKKLIEVALPLEAISIAASYEKSIRLGHPSTLHQWWSRKPLAACRAVLFASLIDDPDQSGVPNNLLDEIDRLPLPQSRRAEWPDLPIGEQRRQRLFTFIEHLIKWENSNNEQILATARQLIRAATENNPPPVYDPFAGGGSIPLEAQRLGLEAHASDLNPVAVLINKALIEIPPKFTNMPPVNPINRHRIGAEWKGMAGLAADVRHYGQWMRDEAEKRIGHLYPKAKLPKEYGGGEATVIAWLWARTAKCPNPACGAQMPLASAFALSNKKGKETWIEPVVDRATRSVSFTIRKSTQKAEGTVNRTGAKCIVCNTTVPFDYLRSEGQSGRLGIQMLAIAAEGTKGRVYLPPSQEHSDAAKQAHPNWKPNTEIPEQALGFRVQIYGLTHHSDLFLPRQLTALEVFAQLVEEVHQQVQKDARKIDVSNAIGDNRHVVHYADAIATYLALAVSKTANRCNALVPWGVSVECPVNLFSRQAIPMAWHFAEANVISDPSGSFESMLDNTLLGIVSADTHTDLDGFATQQDAMSGSDDNFPALISTDPPYYDNISYADLSDFFYVWLQYSLKNIYPNLFSTLLSPKHQELVADPFRWGSREQAKKFFENGITKAFSNMRKRMHRSYPLTIYYAFKQSEENSDEEDGNLLANGGSSSVASTGWETMLEGLIRSDFIVTGTWPIRTERASRIRSLGSNALASSIVLVCRPRPSDAPATTRLDFIRALRRELPEALRNLQHGNIAPVDLAQAAIGPGMAIFSRHRAVLEADGTPMRVRIALQLINQALDEVLAEQEGEYDTDTRWGVAWFDQFGVDEGSFGTAETLSKAKNTSVGGMVDAGIIVARAGKVRLLKRDELPKEWDPAGDKRLTAWETVQHLVYALDKRGEQGAAVLLARIPGDLADVARDLAYRLYAICERKKWAQEALAYNALVVAWPEIARLATERAKDAPVQGRMEL